MFRSWCSISLSEEWKSNREVKMKDVELGGRDLQLVDQIFQRLEFDREGRVALAAVREVLEELAAWQGTQAIVKKLGSLEGRVHCLDLLSVVKTGLKLYKMTGGRLSRIKVDEVPQLEQSVRLRDTSQLDVGLKLGILRMFSRMDPDNSGYVDEAEFEAYIREQRLALGKAKITALYHLIKDCTIMEGPGEELGITYQDLLQYFETHGDSAEMRRESGQEQEQEVSGGGRWKPFENFHRAVGDEAVMTSEEGILRDYLPGMYFMRDIVHYPDLPGILPARASIQGVRWEEGSSPDSPGRLIFPPSYKREVPVEIGSSETLSYYGARLSESCLDSRVCLSARHCLDDYTYHPQYLHKWVERSGGGAGLEHHSFDHLDCPLSSPDESGHYVLARYTGFPAAPHLLNLDITAFKVPCRHTVHTPGGVLHTNNYLRGTWRTMLSDQPVQEAKLEQKGVNFSFNLQ